MKTRYRHITKRLLECIQNSPAVLITGARQTGKTTLVRDISSHDGFSYVTFDDLFSQGAADADPVGFVDDLVKPVILDEVQCAPKIFSPIKKDIDLHRQAGRYILTGSANPLVIPGLGDSLAGRMQMIHLWPFSQGELHDTPESFIDAVFDEKTPRFSLSNRHKESFLNRIVRGGYPAMQDLVGERAMYDWCNGYLTALIQKDITDLAKIENLRAIPNVLQVLATRAGSLLNERDISRSVQIPLTTLRRYLQLLQHLFLVFFLPGWFRNLGKRVIKAPKIYFVDTAILLHLLGFNEERLMGNRNILGHVVDNFVITEILKQLTWSDTIAKPFHYRTHDGFEEVDIVLEGTSGKIVGIEIKYSETITTDDFKGLKKLQEEAGNGFHLGIVLYAGDKQQPFGKGLIALPIQSLWSKVE